MAGSTMLSQGIEIDSMDSITARRNVLTALWAGGLQGFSGSRLSDYATDVLLIGQSDESFILAIERDLASMPTEDIRTAMVRFHRVALHQSAVTD
jgi:hypothetical protein